MQLCKGCRQLSIWTADAPCASACSKRVYPAQEDFAECKRCSIEDGSYKHHDLAGIEILVTLNYSRSSQLLGAAQSSMANTFVRLLKLEGTEVRLFFQSCESLVIARLSLHDHVHFLWFWHIIACDHIPNTLTELCENSR